LLRVEGHGSIFSRKCDDSMSILGIMSFNHGDAAFQVRDWKIISAVQEEQVTFRINDPTFPEKVAA
jgi:predicted NodU family carbamoyl transferase